jgi:mannose-6-phosphate isomerase-like protein (cupin superfamily)
MSYTRERYDDVEPRAPGMHSSATPLTARTSVSPSSRPARAGRMEHDHDEQAHEEVYVLLEGEGTFTVDGETFTVEAGDAVRVDPGSSRQLSFAEESLMVIAGAP